MVEINVQPGRVALVDDRDVACVSAYKWHVLAPRKNRTIYAVAYFGDKAILMHRLILGVEPKSFVDHRNHNGLDNRRGNLRICTSQENAFNRRVSLKTASGLKGVKYDSSSRRKKVWRAQATLNGKKIYLGRFLTAQEAHDKYREFVIKEHGAFAHP